MEVKAPTFLIREERFDLRPVPIQGQETLFAVQWAALVKIGKRNVGPQSLTWLLHSSSTHAYNRMWSIRSFPEEYRRNGNASDLMLAQRSRSCDV